MTEDEIYAHCIRMFGLHGGINDPPPESAVRAIIRGTLDWLWDNPTKREDAIEGLLP